MRNSKRGPSSHTLDILCNSKVWHLQIRQRPDGCYALGKEKKDELVRFLKCEDAADVTVLLEALRTIYQQFKQNKSSSYFVVSPPTT